MLKALLLSAALLAVPVVAQAEDDPYPLLGASVDAGVPSGIGVSVLARPLPFLRAHGGLGTNGASLGLHVGASLIPVQWIVSPALTLEAGHFFEGEFSGFAGALGFAPEWGDASDIRFGYTYTSALLGLEVGSQRHFNFFLRGGLTYLHMPVDGITEALEGSQKDMRFEAEPATFSGVFPAFEAGIQIFVY